MSRKYHENELSFCKFLEDAIGVKRLLVLATDMPGNHEWESLHILKKSYRLLRQWISDCFKLPDHDWIEKVLHTIKTQTPQSHCCRSYQLQFIAWWLCSLCQVQTSNSYKRKWVTHLMNTQKERARVKQHPPLQHAGWMVCGHKTLLHPSHV